MFGIAELNAAVHPADPAGLCPEVSIWAAEHRQDVLHQHALQVALVLLLLLEDIVQRPDAEERAVHHAGLLHAGLRPGRHVGIQALHHVRHVEVQRELAALLKTKPNMRVRDLGGFRRGCCPGWTTKGHGTLQTSWRKFMAAVLGLYISSMTS